LGVTGFHSCSRYKLSWLTSDFSGPSGLGYQSTVGNHHVAEAYWQAWNRHCATYTAVKTHFSKFISLNEILK
jgi:hypothetical protein